MTFTLGLYLTQLFANLHPTFANKFLQHVDSDEILICEADGVANQTAVTLAKQNLPMPKSDKLINEISADQFDNVVVKLDMGGRSYCLNLNAKVNLLYISG